MIAYLKGQIISKGTNSTVIDVNGVGYFVNIPLSTFYVIGEKGDDISLDIYTHVREDSLSLYGFSSHTERSLFVKLISISGIGPSLAMNILSGSSVADFVSFVLNKDALSLTTIPGVGKKTAERIILELSGKLKDIQSGLKLSGYDFSGSDGKVVDDVSSALVNLGYKQAEAERAARESLKELDEKAELDLLLKTALKKLSKL